MIQAEGQEVLVLDADPKVQKGMEHLLRAAGLTPTVMSDARRAVELVGDKFFAVAMVDLDTPHADGGPAVIEALRKRSPKTAILAMAPRRVFDAAVLAFRAGADDVVVKTPDQVDYLRARVVELATERKKTDHSAHIVEQATAVHEDLMKVLLDTWKRVIDLEERREGDETELDEVTSVLLVEDDGWLREKLEAMLDERYELETIGTGGEALDAAGGEKRFQIALVRESLPDLPGSMVVRTVKAQSPDTIVLLVAPPSGPDAAGSIQVIETQRAIPFIPEFTDPRQLTERLDEIREAFRATTRERRYLGSFRQQHFDLLKRYAEVKQRLARAREE